MTWKHVALVALAVGLMGLCITSAMCASNPTALERASFVALAIVSFVGGNATSSSASHTKQISTPLGTAKETERNAP